MFDSKDKDLSWGMVALNHCSASCEGKELFQSDVKSSKFMELVIKRASVSRELGRDWVFGEDTICKIYLSPNQFSNLLVSTNCGDGVPCTISYVKGEGHIPYREEPNKLQIIEKERCEAVDESINGISKVIDMIKDLSSKKKLSNKVAEELLYALNGANENLKNGGSDFLKKQAKNEIDDMVIEAKSQIQNYMEQKVYSMGLEKIVEINKEIPKLKELKDKE